MENMDKDAKNQSRKFKKKIELATLIVTVIGLIISIYCDILISKDSQVKDQSNHAGGSSKLSQPEHVKTLGNSEKLSPEGVHLKGESMRDALTDEDKDNGRSDVFRRIREEQVERIKNLKDDN